MVQYVQGQTKSKNPYIGFALGFVTSPHSNAAALEKKKKRRITGW